MRSMALSTNRIKSAIYMICKLGRGCLNLYYDGTRANRADMESASTAAGHCYLNVMKL